MRKHFEITLHLRAMHFQDTNFFDPCGCPVATAAMEHFNVCRQDVAECVNWLCVGGRWYDHDNYTSVQYHEDKDRADYYYHVRNMPGEIIRTITLKFPTNEKRDPIADQGQAC